MGWVGSGGAGSGRFIVLNDLDVPEIPIKIYFIQVLKLFECGRVVHIYDF